MGRDALDRHRITSLSTATTATANPPAFATTATSYFDDGGDMTVAPVDIPRIEAPVTAKAYLMCAFSAFAGALFGYDSGYIASVLPMKQFTLAYGTPSHGQYDLVAWQKGVVVGILSVGTFCGALISGVLADRIGRRSTILVGCAIFATGVALQISITTVAALSLGRLVAGLGVGFVSAINILYLCEVAPRKVRGAIISLYQFAITLGLLLASCVGYATKDRTDRLAFGIPIGVQFIWALILAVGLYLLPESPRYFVKRGDLPRAVAALSRLRGQPQDSHALQDELAEIQANYEYEQHVGLESWRGCFAGRLADRSSNMRKLFIGMCIQMLQQFSGINFVFYYNTTFFQIIGIRQPFIVSIINNLVNVISTPVSFYTIERFGRRPLLIYGALGMSACEFAIAAVWTRDPASPASNLVLIIFSCVYIFFFASTWGPAAWVVVGEIFHLPIRAKGVAISTASNWFWNAVIASFTPLLVEDAASSGRDLGGRVYFIWGSTCLLAALFAFALVPETKGLTLEQVDQMMDEVGPLHSARWRVRVTAHDLDPGMPARPVRRRRSPLRNAGTGMGAEEGKGMGMGMGVLPRRRRGEREDEGVVLGMR